MAAWKGHEGVVRRLLEAGADVNKAKTISGWTPLRVAIHHRRHEVAALLVQRDASAGNLAPDAEQMKGFLKWATGKAQKAEATIAELVGGIPEWCARAASEARVHNSSDDGGKGREARPRRGKRKAAELEGNGGLGE